MGRWISGIGAVDGVVADLFAWEICTSVTVIKCSVDWRSWLPSTTVFSLGTGQQDIQNIDSVQFMHICP
ncbi:hypothetical protein M3661_21075 [Paenibacillus sp. MER 180]|uniref:hypothetical protein n=1 Tax=Paenibacillus sp. MER 180 TaxID=2939570 RepID=UPI00203E6DA3|nr:hypothetical protein [Paenibacillus sp. MER 180]MCM3292617.1 hypothetical protein [Paenibacillus sp. MER 180]